MRHFFPIALRVFVLSVLLNAFWVGNPPIVQAAGISPIVWKASANNWVRDPNLFRTQSGHYILSGTARHIVEYPDIAPAVFNPTNGKPFVLSILSPNGKRRVRKSGLIDWQKSFLETDTGLVMIASLPTVRNYNTDRVSQAKRRSVFVFEPMNTGRATDSGFPLDWKMKSNKPFLKAIYNGDIFENKKGRLFLYTDVRQDRKLKTTCILGQTLSRSLKLGQPSVLLCPGRAVGMDIDPTGWDRDHPFASEVRHTDGGGLIEGGWAYRAGNRRIFMLYSSGDYANEKLYGGFLALCSSPMGPCTKTLNAGQTDSRPFLKGSSKNYHRVGRPYPVVDARGKLTDIIFHARRRGARKDDILRCTNFTPKILQNFVRGGPGCEYDDVRY